MHFKLNIMTDDHRTKDVLEATREDGATGCMMLNQARGEGVTPTTTFLGLTIDSQVDVILMPAEEHMCRNIIETVALAGEFDQTPGSGITFQIDVEDAIGVPHQIEAPVDAVVDRL